MKRFGNLALLIQILAFPATVLALGFESFGNDPQGKKSNWIEGVVNVVNLRSRVYSYWVSGSENFFYRGNAEALNEAIRAFAGIQGEGHELVLMPGAGVTRSFQGKQITFDWDFNPQSIYWSTDKIRPPRLTVYINALKPRDLDRKSVEKWIGDLESDSFQAREKAMAELERFGNDAKPFLRAAYKAQRAPEQQRRLEILLEKLPAFDVTDLEIPKGIKPISVDGLVAVHLKGANDRLRGSGSIYALVRLAPYSDQVVPALTDLLQKGQNTQVRIAAATSLADVGVRARPALHALREGLNDPDANILKGFQSAIDHLGKAKVRPGHEEELAKNLLILDEIKEFTKSIAR